METSNHDGVCAMSGVENLALTGALPISCNYHADPRLSPRAAIRADSCGALPLSNGLR
jgi:hypothetical protein